jgi:hypothetical protein
MNDKQRKEYLKINTEGLPMFREHPDFKDTEFALIPPAVTEASVRQILQNLMQNARSLMLEGLANAFSNLSPLFKSHDTFCMKSRIIMNYMHDSSGYFRSNWREPLLDVDRAARNILGQDMPEEHQLQHMYKEMLSKARQEGFPQYREAGPWRIRIFKKGTVHIYIQNDFRQKLNKLLAEYYGYSLGSNQDDDFEEDLLEKKREVVALGPTLDFFPTPAAVVKKMADLTYLSDRDVYAKMPDEVWQTRVDMRKKLRCLEPSAGLGHIAKNLARWSDKVDCFELDPNRAAALKAQGIYRSVQCCDFLQQEPPTNKDFGYDRIHANPPFGGKRAITHVYHAAKFLAPYGVLVSVMYAGTLNRNDKYTTQFRDWVSKHDGRFFDLPAKSFASVGTNVNTILVVIGAGDKGFPS